MSEKILSPKELMAISYEADQAKMREAMDRERKKEEMQREMRDSFENRDVHPEVNARVMRAVRHAAELGKREVLAITFPASFCNDHGRAINNGEADWHKSLEGFAKRAHLWFDENLRPQGFKTRAEIMNYPGGMPGDVGVYICW